MILLDLAVKASLLLALGAVCALTLRHASAASRHAVWTTVFVAMLLLPLARVVMPEWSVIELPARFRAVPAAQAPVFSSSAGGDLQTREPNSNGADGDRGWLTRRDPAGALIGLWLAGLVAGALWIGVGMVGARRLERLARPMDDERVRGRARQAAEWLGVRRSIRLLAVSNDSMPITWGLRTPRVLLPEVARAWSDERLDAVLTHELSHVVRNDALSHLVARLATAVWWWHPLVWIAAGAARLERERACDDLVLTTGTRASDYAADLVTFVSSLEPPVPDSPALLAMARRSQLEGRVMAILESGVNRKGVSQAGILAAMLVMVLVWPLAAARPAMQEQEQEQQQPVRVGGSLPQPKKIKDVRPIYPAAAMAEGRQGIAIVEAAIGTDGTVTDAKIIRSIGDDLDVAAIEAVRQWRFMPTTLNGQPVPVIMTVTVNFRLDADGKVVSPTPPAGLTGAELSAFLAGVARGEQGGVVGGVAGGVMSDTPMPMWSPGDPPLRIGGAIKEPKKIKDVRPVYPPEAQDARVSGIVILEILIDEEGMVSEARVIRPVALLDEAARDAVMQWRFTPTVVNGHAAPVIMTVTVNFTLQGSR